MAILITSPGLVTTGTEGADDIRFATTGVVLTGNQSVVNALAGNDTITVADLTVVSGASVGAGPEIYGQGGADVITFTSAGATTSANNTVINGGAGGDTITLSAATFGNVAGADGGDLITIGSSTLSGLGAGGGKDTVYVSGISLATGATIGLGAGADVFSGAVDFTSGAGILGGGGADTITLNTISGVGGFVNGDSTSDGGAADVITISGAATTATIVRGKGGADTISIAELGQSAVVAGNAGGDVIEISGFSSDAAIRGGQGGDSLTFDGTEAANSAEIVGGGGKDTITIASAGDIDNVTMIAGAGVDSITFSGAIANTRDLGVIGISDLGDSKLGSIDTFDVSGLAAGDNASVDFETISPLSLGSAAVLGSIANLAATDAAGTGFFTGVGQSGSVTNGAMSFSGQFSASVATAATYADAVTRIGSDATDAGKAVLFVAGDDEYLFIQGGAAGTDDDYILKFNGTTGSVIPAGTTTIGLVGE